MVRDFEAVYVEHFRDVYRYAMSLCRDPALAEELTQQAFFKALKGIDSFQGTCSVRAWLCQITKNAYFDHLRKHKRLSPIEHAPEASGGGADVALLESENSRGLHRALHHLPEPYKEVFSLRVFAELGFQEISQLFQKSESWARVTYHRARLQLMERVKEEET